MVLGNTANLPRDPRTAGSPQVSELAQRFGPGAQMMLAIARSYLSKAGKSQF